jgi:HD domain
MGLLVPDSLLAEQVEELVREVSPPFLANHCMRCAQWATALAQCDGVGFDAELLYVSAALHDLGLVPRFDADRCFEDDSAKEAARITSEAGWSAERCDVVAEVIRLHMAAEVSLEDGPEAYLLAEATALDVTGYRYGDLDRRMIEAVLDEFPRLDFKVGFSRLFTDQAARKPGCRVAALVDNGILDRIAGAPYAT